MVVGRVPFWWAERETRRDWNDILVCCDFYNTSLPLTNLVGNVGLSNEDICSQNLQKLQANPIARKILSTVWSPKCAFRS